MKKHQIAPEKICYYATERLDEQIARLIASVRFPITVQYHSELCTRTV